MSECQGCADLQVTTAALEARCTALQQLADETAMRGNAAIDRLTEEKQAAESQLTLLRSALRGVVEQWRKKADDTVGEFPVDPCGLEQPTALRRCADDLATITATLDEQEPPK